MPAASETSNQKGVGQSIEVQIENAGQLFQTLDPFPFHKRDLDREAEEFIVGWARELPKDAPFSIVIHLPEKEARSEQPQALDTALHQYFSYRADWISKELKELFRIGRYSLAIGLAALAVCVVLSRIAQSAAGNGDLGRFVSEGLIILGWVANWRPIEIFLYDWWPLVRRGNLYRRLAAANVKIVVR
jgi:hypothetical protein